MRAPFMIQVAVLLMVPFAGYGQTTSGTFKVVCLANASAPDIAGRKACLNTTPRLTFRNELTLAVEHAPEVDFDDVAEPNPGDLVLFLDGKPLHGTHPQVGRSQVDADDVTTTLLTFRLSRDLSTKDARKHWKEVLEAAQARPLTVSAGLATGAAARSNATIDLEAVPSGRLFMWVMAAVVLAAGFLWAALRTGVLRDKEEAGKDINKPTDRAYSLARVQMAFWTLLTVYAYLYIWFLTGEYKATIPPSVVGLMGIALGTFGVATALDAAKVATSKEKLADLRDKAPTSAGKAELLQQDGPKLEARAKVCKSDGFFTDITTSAGGASLHRLQFILWTLVLGGIFVATVWKTIAMPDFDAELLALMGVTAGGYVTLKVPEDKC